MAQHDEENDLGFLDTRVRTQGHFRPGEIVHVPCRVLAHNDSEGLIVLPILDVQIGYVLPSGGRGSVESAAHEERRESTAAVTRVQSGFESPPRTLPPIDPKDARAYEPKYGRDPVTGRALTASGKPRKPRSDRSKGKSPRRPRTTKRS